LSCPEEPIVPPTDPEGAPTARFTTTCWTVIVKAADQDTPEARQALADLCQAYWYPLYAYLRRRGHSPHEAEDLTQGFFTDILARGSLKAVDPERGRFRSFLLAALKHYVSNRRDWDRRQRRGGKIPHLSLDFGDAESCYLREPAHEETPESLFQRRWALTLIARALDRLETEVAAENKGPLFERLKYSLMGEGNTVPHARLGEELGMSEGAVKVAVHRLRKRFKALLQEEIARTLADPGDFPQEINELFLILSR
jgi:RNA polymerase sigma-70 factor (ECF subfamily)